MRGTYHDGETARSHPVDVRVGAEALTLVGEDGRVLATWRGADIRLRSSLRRRGAAGDISLSAGNDNPARLVIPAADADLAVLERVCPNLRKGHGPDWQAWQQVGLWTAAAAVSVALLIKVVIPALATEIALAIPAATERRLGERVARDVISLLAGDAEPAVCGGTEGQAALDGLVRRLAAGLDAAAGIRVRVVNTEQVNAFAVPGGEILILRGLIDQAETPDEVAGVLAHEIAHVVRRDPTIVTLQTAATSVLIGLLVGDVTGGSVIAGLGTVLVGASYSRDAEREADALGVDLLHRAGIGTGGLTAFLTRLNAAHGDLEEMIGFLNTHPLSADRLAALPAAASPAPAPAVDAVAWQAIRAICD